jgi:fumarylacetoacetase
MESAFIHVDPASDFSLHNLPYGIFTSDKQLNPRVCTAIGEYVVDLAYLAERGFFQSVSDELFALFSQPVLNPFIASGKLIWQGVRARLINLLRADNPELRDNVSLHPHVFYPLHSVKLHLPLAIGDYTDFYSSINHARHVGALFRDKDNPLLPNYLHLPVGYHGRSSSIVVSGTPIYRPMGQTLPQGETLPNYAPTQALDFELEVAFVIGKNTQLGHSIPIDDAEDFIFGLTLLNDWSARDVQRWEYVPLGPFLSKSFATTISPWIVTLEALKPFYVKSRTQTPLPLPYLCRTDDFSLDLNLTVTLQTQKMFSPQELTHTNYSELYWTMSQQLAHHTMNGCPVNVGDLMASGTISGDSPTALGCLLEITMNGQMPLTLSSGESRIFLQDGDIIALHGYCQGDGYRVGFGHAVGLICPSLSMAKM